MAQAIRSLSPKQIRERTQQHHQAVMILAHRRARKAVERELQEQGLKPRYMALREINQLAHDYLAKHRAELLAEAEHAIATCPIAKAADLRFSPSVFAQPRPISDISDLLPAR